MKEHPTLVLLGVLASIATILTFLQLDVDWPWEDDASSPPGGPIPAIATSTPSPIPDSDSPQPDPEPTATPTPPDSSTCVITVTNPLVPLHEEPENFSQEIMTVPVGDYTVTDTANTDFAGKTERWLAITVEGRTGWIQDNTIIVASKSAACQ